MSLLVRKGSFLTLVLIFFLQTWFVYTDSTGYSMPALTPLAAQGRALWHEKNCQSCHQLYGFGGFLGPDLTNASEGLTQARFDMVLTEGALQMPAFHFDEEQRQALMAFLSEINKTGVGELRAAPGSKPGEVLQDAIDAILVGGVPELDASQVRGRDLVISLDCLGCHLPNPLSEKQAPSLALLVPKLTGPGVLGIVTSGIPAKGMPAFDLDAQQATDLVAFLSWLAANQSPLQRVFDARSIPPGTTTIPWFEYSR